MRSRYLLLLVIVTLSVAGVSEAVSGTAIDLIDQTHRELQTRVSSKLDKSDATYQNVLATLQQARESLSTGNEDAALQQLAQLRNFAGLTDEGHAAVEAIIQQIHMDHSNRVAAYNNQVEEICQRAATAVSQAKAPKDLDATLQELARESEQPNLSRVNDFYNYRGLPKLQAVINFVTQWQDYLLARGHSTDSAITSMLRTLASVTPAPLIPRSEILARIPQSAPEVGPPALVSRPIPGPPPPQVETTAIEIIQGIKTLDDVPTALAKLMELRKEIAASSSPGVGSDSALGVALNGLQMFQRTILEAENGLNNSLGFGFGRSEYTSHPEVESALLPLRVLLVKRAAFRLMSGNGASDENSESKEPLSIYLQKLIDAAKKRQDWAAVVRGLEFSRSLSVATSTPYLTGSDQEISAFQNFFAGSNLEQAGQYEEAVASYLTALRTGQNDLPSGLIGERLAAIQKTHPAEFARGSGRAAEASRESYEDLMRARREQFDSGFQNRHEPVRLTKEDKSRALVATPTPSPAATVPPATPTPSPSPSTTPVPSPTPTVLGTVTPGP